MPAKISLIGQRFRRLLVIEELPPKKPGHLVYLCECICGTKCSVTAADLRRGDTKSCGCLRRELGHTNQFKHGEAGKNTALRTPEYRAWQEMKRRCTDPCRPYYKHYGGRGITVCERWLTYNNFLADMGRKPHSKTSLDRINNEGNYEPSNCRWTDGTTQRLNQRRMVKLN